MGLHADDSTCPGPGFTPSQPHLSCESAHSQVRTILVCKQDKLQQASSRVADRSASPEQGKLATRLRAELEVNKEALQAAQEEGAILASSLQKANSLIEV